jgi:cellulose synthase/poly-beta-1,6-N-acetylglucosamine synthase-like glycosyltransferase
MAFFLFSISSALLLWAFLGYPIFLLSSAKLFGRRKKVSGSFAPPVSIIVSVYNEEAVIQNKLDNFLQLFYPQYLLELIVVSDHSEDRTEAIVEDLQHPRIKLLRQTARKGKTQALNRAALEAKGSILVFTDANSMFDRLAISNLVRHFEDPAIGLVSGRSIYADSSTKKASVGGIYRRYEDLIKRYESAIGSIVGADGAVYALRKTLYKQLPPEYINDFIHPIQVVLEGYEARIDDKAFCIETIECNIRGEFRRQTRIMAQSWRIFFGQIGHLIYKRRILYAAELISHKFLRWLAFPLLAVLLVSCLALASNSMRLDAAAAFGSLFFIAILALRFQPPRHTQAVALFLTLHMAAISGLLSYLRRKKFATWNPRSN